MECPGCGRARELGAAFCTYCGARFTTDTELGGHHLDAEKRRLREAVAARRSGDRTVPPWIVVVPLVLIIVAVVTVFAAVLSTVADYDLAAGEVPTERELLERMGWIGVVSISLNVLFYGFFAVIAYRLVDEANGHMRREEAVTRAVTDLLRKIGGPRAAQAAPSMWSAQSSVPDPAVRGTVRNPFVWALAVLLPLAGSIPQALLIIYSEFETYASLSVFNFGLVLVHALLLFYLLHFLSDDLWRHESVWTEFAHGTRVSLAAAGVTAGMIQVDPPMARRSTGLYVVLSFITAGLFVFYWWYVVIKDPADHYAKQSRFEDGLLELVSRGA